MQIYVASSGVQSQCKSSNVENRRLQRIFDYAKTAILNANPGITEPIFGHNYYVVLETEFKLRIVTFMILMR